MSKFLTHHLSSGSMNPTPEFKRTNKRWPRQRVYGRITNVIKVRKDGVSAHVVLVANPGTDEGPIREGVGGCCYMHSVPGPLLDAAWAAFKPHTRSTGLKRYAFWKQLIGMYFSCTVEIAPSNTFGLALLRPRHAIAHDLDAAAYALENCLHLSRNAVAIPLREMVNKHGHGPSLALKRGVYVTYSDDGDVEVKMIYRNGPEKWFLMVTATNDLESVPLTHPTID